MNDLFSISELELLSVICIETSHYVCFTRVDQQWIFFDSMANRVCKFNGNSGESNIVRQARLKSLHYKHNTVSIDILCCTKKVPSLGLHVQNM